MDHVKYFFAIVLFRQKLPLLSHLFAVVKHSKLFRKLKNQIIYLIMGTEYSRNSKKEKKKETEREKVVNIFKNHLN